MRLICPILNSAHANRLRDVFSQELRDAFVFKIVPMLNPDGVIVGNYRCSLAARDLNRNYRHPRKTSFPTIWHTKMLMEEFSQQREVRMTQSLGRYMNGKCSIITYEKVIRLTDI